MLAVILPVAAVSPRRPPPPPPILVPYRLEYVAICCARPVDIYELRREAAGAPR